MKTKSILSLVFALGLISLISVWYWQNSPSFAIREFDKALKQKDLATLYSRIAFDDVYASGLDALHTKALSETKQERNLVETLGSQLSLGIDKLSGGEAVDLIKHELETELRRDRTKPRVFHKKSNSLRSFFSDIERVYFQKIANQSEKFLVNVDVKLLKMQKTYPLTLVFKPYERSHWRLSGFEGLSSALSLYEKDRKEKVDDYNQNLQKNLSDRLTFFGELKKEKTLIGKNLRRDILFKNNLSESVIQIKGKIMGGPKEEDFDSGKINLGVSEKKVFLSEESQIFSDDSLDVVPLTFRYEEIHLHSGKILKPVIDFDEI